MFGLFKKKSPLVILEEQHKKLLEESFQMSKINRSKADELYAKAVEIEKQILELKEQK
ncbi:MAG: hypothetical protein RL264_986 [Bacteroidota bacterium]|jgi:hypothetical protein